MLQQAIGSKQNPKIKNLIRLQEQSKERRQQGRLVLHGLLELQQACTANIPLSELYMCESFFKRGDSASIHEWLTSMDQSAEPPTCYNLSESLFGKVARSNNLEGLIAVGKRPAATPKDIALEPETLLIVAECIEKPANMGALARVAEACGAKGLLAIEPTADPFAPQAIHNSRGFIFQLPCVELSEKAFLHYTKTNNIHTLGLHPSACLPYVDFKPAGPLALVVGAEHKGLSNSMLEAVDTQVCIPMRGSADSLNLTNAAATVAFDLQHRRGL